MLRRRSTTRLASALAVVVFVSTTFAAGTPGPVPSQTHLDSTVSAPAPDSSVATDSLRDPALTVATLPNGLRYYLRANAVPAHRVELRLVVNAGSVLEDEDQRGFAHFLEHMAFNGTTHFPHHTLIDFLETSGMRFGADLNAFTTQDETVYMLTLPTDDGRILARGLDVLQDWASGGITIDSAAVVAERGVIMGEWRTRLLDTASQTVQAHYDTLFFGGSRYTSRTPIGDTALIETATSAPVRRFYHDWYRPELMAIVVVGDFDRTTMEREIRQRFGTIPAATNRPRVSPAPPSSAAPVIDVYRGKVFPSVEVIWPAPVVPAHTRDAVRQRLVQTLLFESIEQRVLRIGEHPSRPFIAARFEKGRLARPLDLVGVELFTWPDSLEGGLTSVLSEVERVAQHGVPAARLAHQKAVLLARLEHAASSEAGRSSKAYAEAYVAHDLTGDASLLSAQQELALAREILPTVSSEVLALAARFWREPAGTRVLVRLPEFTHVRPPTRETILALFDSVARTPLAPDSDQAAAAGALLATLPTPGRIVSEQRDRAAGITEWTLSNGARVILKPTRNNPDELLMRAWGPGGFAMMPDSLFFTPGRMVAHVMTDVAGLGATNHDALVRQLATTGLRSMNFDIGYADQSIQLAGSPTDLELLFQLLHLQFTAPTLDTATLAGWQSLAKYQGANFSLDDMLNQVFAGGNPRLLPVSTNLAELATVKQLMAVYRNRFGNAGGFTFTLVGAISPDEARPLVERYLASLPATGKPEQPTASEYHQLWYDVNKTSRTLQLPKAQTLLVFDGLFPTAPDAYLQERQRLSALTSVLQDRIRVRLRQELGGTYSPSIDSKTYNMPEERYRVRVVFDAAPERMRQLNRELMNIIDSVRTNGVSEAEATRAGIVQRRQLETRLQDNDYWMATIGDYSRLGIPLDAIPAPYGQRAATPAELQATARRYLPNDSYLHFTAMPEDSSSHAQRDSTAKPGPE